jgi:hypothetical protein
MDTSDEGEPTDPDDTVATLDNIIAKARALHQSQGEKG